MKKAIFWLLILVFLAYLGFKFGSPYYRYLAFKSDAKEIVRVSIEARDEESMRNLIFERAQELKVPIDKTDIEVIKTGTDMRVKTSWIEVVDILGVYQKSLKFDVDTAL
jgi:hypothetical protein